MLKRKISDEDIGNKENQTVKKKKKNIVGDRDSTEQPKKRGKIEETDNQTGSKMKKVKEEVDEVMVKVQSDGIEPVGL